MMMGATSQSVMQTSACPWLGFKHYYYYASKYTRKMLDTFYTFSKFLTNQKLKMFCSVLRSQCAKEYLEYTKLYLYLCII